MYQSLKRPRLAKTASWLYGFVLTYLILAPHPLWVFGAAGGEVELAVDSTISEYVQHGMAYALFALVLAWASWAAIGRVYRLPLVVVILVHAFVGEWLQLYIPHRYCDWRDALANFLGIIVGGGFAFLFLRMMRDRQVATSS